jgi:hypothetical protein
MTGLLTALGLAEVEVEDTWFSRDLPVLDAVVTLLDQPGSFMAQVRDIAEKTGMDPNDIARALEALDGTYVEFEQFATGGNPNSWRVRRVSSDARRAVGQWPTPENIVARLAEAFSAAAERERDPERKGKLRALASFLAETGKDFAAEVVAKVIAHQTGMG